MSKRRKRIFELTALIERDEDGYKEFRYFLAGC